LYLFLQGYKITLTLLYKRAIINHQTKTRETTTMTTSTITTTNFQSADTLVLSGYTCTLTERPAAPTRKMVPGGLYETVPGIGSDFTVKIACPGGGYLSSNEVYKSRQQAFEHVSKDIIIKVASCIPRLPTRAEYENAARDAGYTPLSDAEIAASPYAMEYGNYGMSHYSTETTVTMMLSQARYRTLKTEAAKTEAAKTEAAKTEAAKTEAAKTEGVLTAPPAADIATCPNCGTLVAPKLLMYASLGMACPNCYDDMEDTE